MKTKTRKERSITNNSIYFLIYKIKGKNIVLERSANYVYLKRKKELYDKQLNTEGQIKKLHKS